MQSQTQTSDQLITYDQIPVDVHKLIFSLLNEDELVTSLTLNKKYHLLAKEIRNTKRLNKLFDLMIDHRRKCAAVAKEDQGYTEKLITDKFKLKMQEALKNNEKLNLSKEIMDDLISSNPQNKLKLSNHQYDVISNKFILDGMKILYVMLCCGMHAEEKIVDKEKKESNVHMYVGINPLSIEGKDVTLITQVVFSSPDLFHIGSFDKNHQFILNKTITANIIVSNLFFRIVSMGSVDGLKIMFQQNILVFALAAHQLKDKSPNFPMNKFVKLIGEIKNPTLVFDTLCWIYKTGISVEVGFYDKTTDYPQTEFRNVQKQLIDGLSLNGVSQESFFSLLEKISELTNEEFQTRHFDYMRKFVDKLMQVLKQITFCKNKFTVILAISDWLDSKNDWYFMQLPHALSERHHSWSQLRNKIENDLVKSSKESYLDYLEHRLLKLYSQKKSDNFLTDLFADKRESKIKEIITLMRKGQYVQAKEQAVLLKKPRIKHGHESESGKALCGLIEKAVDALHGQDQKIEINQYDLKGA